MFPVDFLAISFSKKSEIWIYNSITLEFQWALILVFNSHIKEGISKVNIFTDINVAAVKAEFSKFTDMNKGIIDLIPAAVEAEKSNLEQGWLTNLRDVNVCSQKGLAERFSLKPREGYLDL